MIVTYLRSSSYNTHCLCPHRYYLEYVLGVPTLSNKAGDKGNIVHKALELLGRQKMCWQKGVTEYEDETFGLLKAEDIDPKMAIDLSYAYYTSQSPHHTWYYGDFIDCQKWMNLALTWSDGRYDPRGREIIEVEQRFDFVFDEPWAKYDYEMPNGGRLTGHLGLKGTMDLVTRDKGDPKIIEVIDWKTGQRKDWSKDTDAKKTYYDFRCDPQLCLYHYAATRLFPEAEAVFLTIFYVKDGGPFSLCWDEDDLEYTKMIIQKKFQEIRDTDRPELKIGRQCYAFCPYGKAKSEDPNMTVCQFFAHQIKKNGLDYVTDKYGKPNAFLEYGDGGGRKDQG